MNGTSLQRTQHDYHCQIFVSRVTLLSLSLSVAQKIGNVRLQFISQFRTVLSSTYKSNTQSYIHTHYTKKKHFFTLESGKTILNSEHNAFIIRNTSPCVAGVYKAPYIYAITHKQGRATPTSTMDIPVTDTNFVNTLYNAHANRRH